MKKDKLLKHLVDYYQGLEQKLEELSTDINEAEIKEALNTLERIQEYAESARVLIINYLKEKA